jgi:hypothetical protein
VWEKKEEKGEEERSKRNGEDEKIKLAEDSSWKGSCARNSWSLASPKTTRCES